MFFIFLNDVKESAIKSGYKKEKAERTGVKLLARKNIREEIKRLRNQFSSEDPQELAKMGLWKIAFSDITRTISSVLKAKSEEGEVDFNDADLFGVSEIKLSKNDVTEIKLFDKIKALQALASLSKNGEENQADKSFFEAFSKGAEGVFGNEK